MVALDLKEVLPVGARDEHCVRYRMKKERRRREREREKKKKEREREREGVEDNFFYVLLLHALDLLLSFSDAKGVGVVSAMRDILLPEPVHYGWRGMRKGKWKKWKRKLRKWNVGCSLAVERRCEEKYYIFCLWTFGVVGAFHGGLWLPDLNSNGSVWIMRDVPWPQCHCDGGGVKER